MNRIIIRHVRHKDLDECFAVETSGFPPEEAATRETIKLRIDTFPQGFLVAEIDGRVVGILNSGATDKDDISSIEESQLRGDYFVASVSIRFATRPAAPRNDIAKNQKPP
jgi:hypothetical protein